MKYQSYRDVYHQMKYCQRSNTDCHKSPIQKAQNPLNKTETLFHCFQCLTKTNEDKNLLFLKKSKTYTLKDKTYRYINFTVLSSNKHHGLGQEVHHPRVPHQTPSHGDFSQCFKFTWMYSRAFTGNNALQRSSNIKDQPRVI